jgi:hypothetical protein
VVVVAVLLAVRVAVTALEPVMFSEAGMLQLTGLVGLLGVLVTAQLSVTAPVNPFDVVMLIVEVLPVVAPWVTEMLPLLLSAKFEPAVTVTFTVVV